MNRRVRTSTVAMLLISLLGVGCAGRKPPGVQLERIKVDGVRLTGASLQIGFRIRNTNPEALNIDRFEYQLKLNGNKLGTGYFPEKVEIAGFDEAKITTRFDLNFLRMPGTVKAILDNKEVDAEVDGTFYVKRGLSTGKLRVSHRSLVPLGKDQPRD